MVNAISFGHRHHHKRAEKQSEQENSLLYMNNHQLAQKAQHKTLNDKDSNRKKVVNNLLFLTIPVVDAFSQAVNPESLNSGILKKSYFAFQQPFKSVLLRWGAILGGFAAVDYVTKKSKTLSNFEEKHPLAKFALDVAAVFGAIGLVANNKEKHISSIINNKKALSSAETFFEESIKMTDDSKIAKKVYKPAVEAIEKFAKTHPSIAKGAKKVIPALFPVALGLYALKIFIIDPSSLKKRFVNNYNNLKIQQNNARTEYIEAKKEEMQRAQIQSALAQIQEVKETQESVVDAIEDIHEVNQQQDVAVESLVEANEQVKEAIAEAVAADS